MTARVTVAHMGIEGTACADSLAAKRASPYLATPYSGRAWAIAETDATRAAMAISVLIFSDPQESKTSMKLINAASHGRARMSNTIS